MRVERSANEDVVDEIAMHGRGAESSRKRGHVNQGVPHRLDQALGVSSRERERRETEPLS